MSLKQIFEEHPERRYIMFGGKGGLGKTTFSAATAYWLASQGKKVLVFSVDPQASLSDIFQKDIFGKGPVKIMENLWAQEIDADQHIKTYQNEIRQKILDMYGFEAVPDEIEQYIQAASAEPAMEESAIFDAVVDIVIGGEYDYYIYDLVPLGHALYYLSMAKVYDEWITKITKLREEMREYEEMVSRMKREKETEEDQILTELQYIRTRINASSSILTDREKTGFFFVIIPEEMILIDEVLTPDSSRFWPKDSYTPGGPQKSFDKQYLRDYLRTLDWKKEPPAPQLPPEVIENTRARYLEALKRLAGRS